MRWELRMLGGRTCNLHLLGLNWILCAQWWFLPHCRLLQACFKSWTIELTMLLPRSFTWETNLRVSTLQGHELLKPRNSWSILMNLPMESWCHLFSKITIRLVWQNVETEGQHLEIQYPWLCNRWIVVYLSDHRKAVIQLIYTKLWTMSKTNTPFGSFPLSESLKFLLS